MAAQQKPVTAAESDKQRQLRETRERLEALGVAEETVPDPVSGEEAAGGRGHAGADDMPDQASVQPAAPVIKDSLKK